MSHTLWATALYWDYIHLIIHYKPLLSESLLLGQLSNKGNIFPKLHQGQSFTSYIGKSFTVCMYTD